MSRPLPLVIALLGLASAAAFAQEGEAPRRFVPSATAKKPGSPPTTTTGSAKPRRAPFVQKADEGGETAGESEERPMSFWERLFGRRKSSAATPAPATPPPATPKATPRPRKPKSTTAAAKVKDPAVITKRESTSEVTTTDSPTLTPVAKATSAPKAAPAPKPTKKTAASVVTTPSATPARKAPVPPAPSADAEAQEKYQYEVAKEKALQDPEVQKLKEKADGAVSDEEARKAQRAYNKALFSKMRSIDGSIKERADRIEAAILKRLDSPE